MTVKGMSNFTDDRHALYVGWVCGIANRQGVRATPIVDADGDYTDRIQIQLSNLVYVEVIVPPPPDDWSL